MDVGGAVCDALAQVGIVSAPAVVDGGTDLIVDPAGAGVKIELTYRALVTEADVDRLLASHQPSDGALLVVGDRITNSARRRLIKEAGGYYDLRGRLALRSGLMVIDVEIEPVAQRHARVDALSGKVGLEVAAHLLMNPGEPAKVRELARTLGRSASTVSEVLRGLRGSGLLNGDNTLIGTGLFWAVVDVWSSTPTYSWRFQDQRTGSRTVR